MLKNAGRTTGTALSISSIMTTAPKMLPKSRAARDKGLTKRSKRFIKRSIGDLKKCFKNPKNPLALNEAIMTVTIDIIARAEVVLKSFVGGVKPKMLMVFAIVKKAATVPKYGA